MKLELYKPYRTRNGHKAVVVDGPLSDGTFTAYHINGDQAWNHDPDGGYNKPSNQHDKKFDLISEWHEPRSGEFWVNVYEDGPGCVSWLTKEDADAAVESAVRIALKRVTWTEGDEE